MIPGTNHILDIEELQLKLDPWQEFRMNDEFRSKNPRKEVKYQWEYLYC